MTRPGITYRAYVFLNGKIVKRQLGIDLQNNDHLINQWKIISGSDLNIKDLQEITYHSLDVCHDQGLKAESVMEFLGNCL